MQWRRKISNRDDSTWLFNSYAGGSICFWIIFWSYGWIIKCQKFKSLIKSNWTFMVRFETVRATYYFNTRQTFHELKSPLCNWPKLWHSLSSICNWNIIEGIISLSIFNFKNFQLGSWDFILKVFNIISIV